MTNEQSAVIEAKISSGYKSLGKYAGTSGVVGLCEMLVKGKHTVLINALGYDEYQRVVMYKEVA